MTRQINLKLENVTKNFGDKQVLHNINLTINEGEFIAVVGKSGSGKSTLLRLISGLDTPSSGTILINDEPLKGRNEQARVMFQDARLLPWQRVINNVGLGLRGDWKPQAQAVLEHIQLADRANEWPSVLSGGERQRVALARALIRRPSLLLLDEPLGALDALTRIEMQSLIESLWQEHKFTAFLITHDVEEAVVLADRVLLLEDGYITLDLPIALSRPRQRGSAEFAQLKDHILQRVMGLTTEEHQPLIEEIPQEDYKLRRLLA